MEGKISDHFYMSEVSCNCGCGLAIYNADTIRLMEFLRNHFNKPIIVHCWCRCPKHNSSEDVKGSVNSQHLPKNDCSAVDFHVQGLSNAQLRKEMKKLYRQGKIVGGLGLYRWGCHVDTARKRRWGRYWNNKARNEG